MDDLMGRIEAALEDTEKSADQPPSLEDAGAMTMYDTALRLMRKALQEEDIRAADENLAILESLPLDSLRRAEVAAMGERILTAEFKEALGIVETLLRE
jgi:hypothetical protein